MLTLKNIHLTPNVGLIDATGGGNIKIKDFFVQDKTRSSQPSLPDQELNSLKTTELMKLVFDFTMSLRQFQADFEHQESIISSQEYNTVFSVSGKEERHDIWKKNTDNEAAREDDHQQKFNVQYKPEAKRLYDYLASRLHLNPDSENDPSYFPLGPNGFLGRNAIPQVADALDKMARAIK
jgi:hypothetical protein